MPVGPAGETGPAGEAGPAALAPSPPTGFATSPPLPVPGRPAKPYEGLAGLSTVLSGVFSGVRSAGRAAAESAGLPAVRSGVLSGALSDALSVLRSEKRDRGRSAAFAASGPAGRAEALSSESREPGELSDVGDVGDVGDGGELTAPEAPGPPAPAGEGRSPGLASGRAAVAAPEVAEGESPAAEEDSRPDVTLSGSLPGCVASGRAEGGEEGLSDTAEPLVRWMTNGAARVRQPPPLSGHSIIYARVPCRATGLCQSFRSLHIVADRNGTGRGAVISARNAGTVGNSPPAGIAKKCHAAQMTSKSCCPPTTLIFLYAA